MIKELNKLKIQKWVRRNKDNFKQTEHDVHIYYNIKIQQDNKIKKSIHIHQKYSKCEVVK